MLEVPQQVSQSRHGRVPDGLAKAAGALLGIALGMVAERILRHWKAAGSPSEDHRLLATGERTPSAPPTARVRAIGPSETKPSERVHIR